MTHTYPNSNLASVRRLHPRAAIIRRVEDAVIAFDTAGDALGHPSAQVLQSPEWGRA